MTPTERLAVAMLTLLILLAAVGVVSLFERLS